METIPKATKSWITILVMSVIILAGPQIRSQPVTIDLIKGCETKGSIKLSEIADHISYVKLETTKDCLIGRPNKLFFFKDNWFIQQGGILRFDNTGKFLNRISGRGKGPGEFIELSGIGFNTNNDHVYVINRLTNRAMEFLLDGKLTGTIKNTSGLSILLNNQYFVNYFTLRGLFLSQGYRVTVVSLDGKIQQKFLKQDLSKIVGNIHMNGLQMDTYKDSITCYDTVTDTVYRISSDLKLTPRYILNFGREALPFYLKVPHSSPDYWTEMDKYSYVSSFVECDRFLFLAVVRKGKFLNMIYNKANGNCFTIDPSIRVINDLDEGHSFWPMGITDDGRLYNMGDPIDFKSQFGGSPSNSLSSDKMNKSLKSIVENSKDDDNPILIILTPKK